MKKIIRACIIFSFFFLCSKALCTEDIQLILDECVLRNKTAGMAVAIIDEDGIRYYSSGYTNNDKVQLINENTLFEIGSVTKVITTVMLQKLIDKGDFALSDTLQMHMPSYVHVPTYNGNEINLLHLATNYAGFPYVPENSNVKDLSNPFAGYTVDLLYEYLNTKKLNREPGTEYEYSNLGMGLLGHIMELRYNMSYEDIVKKEICESLGMENTCVTLSNEQKNHFAIGHVGDAEVGCWDLPCIEAAGGLRSTAKDLARFIAANLNLFPCDFYESMEKTHTALFPAVNSHMKIALGWHVSSLFENIEIGHNGSTGGYHSFVGFCKETKRGVVLLTNGCTNIDDIARHFLDNRYEMIDEEEVMVVDPIILDKYVGKYRHLTGLTCRIARKGFKLIGSVIGHPEVLLNPDSNTSFYTTILDAQVEFSMDNVGRVNGLTAIRGDQRFWLKKVE